MRLQLMTLTVDNFKGFRHKEFRFDGRDALIRGRNGAGKTTVYDAFTWLLFGKDSKGDRDFQFRPVSPEGEVLDRAAITAVEAVLLADGRRRIFKRACCEVWSLRRGTGEKAFGGFSSDFYVDGVAVKKAGFDRQVARIVPEDRFRLLTGLFCFSKQLSWRDRRAVLFDVAGVSSDREILDSDPGFAPLAEALGDKPLEQLRKELTARRRGLNKTREDTPARLDECRRLTVELEERLREPSGCAALDIVRRRTDELRGIAHAAADELGEVDKLLLLCDQFARKKVRCIQQDIDKHFERVTFRLAREQINGGFEDCCDVLLDGVAVGDALNTGGEFRAGMDIIRTLSRCYDLYVPLFIDGAERVTGPLDAETQVIRLEAGEGELRAYNQ